MDAVRCLAVWNVGGEPLVQAIDQLAVPRELNLLPVRRIGTYKGARSSIAMYPMMRDGYVLMVSVESRVELGHLMEMSINPAVSDVYAQPFVMVWEHPEGRLHHVPDFAAVIGGRLTIIDVKPSEHLEERWPRVVLDLVARTFRRADIPFEIRGDLSRQRALNLELITRYRRPNLFLQDLVAAALQHRPQTMGGLAIMIEASMEPDATESGEVSFDAQTLRICRELGLHLLATGACRTSLEKPIGITTEFEWATVATEASSST